LEAGKSGPLRVTILRDEWIIARRRLPTLSVNRLVNRVNLHLAQGGSFA